MRALRTAVPAFLLTLAVGGCSDEPSAEPSPRPTAGDSVRTADEMNVVGEWEEGELLGGQLPAGEAYGLPQVMYAVADAADREGRALVSLGLLKEGRIFRILPALSPEDEEAPDGIDLYGGNALDDGTYELLGAAPGRVAVSVEGPDGHLWPVTAQSTEVLPGFTVFHHRGDWQGDWDPVQLAPLVVSTDDGARVEVRERSWVG